MNNRIYEFILSEYGSQSREHRAASDDWEYGMSFAEWSNHYDYHPNRPKDFVGRYWNEASETERSQIVKLEASYRRHRTNLTLLKKNTRLS